MSFFYQDRKCSILLIIVKKPNGRYRFVSGGLVFSICLMIFVAVVCLSAFQILVKAQQTVGGSYGDVAQALYGAWLRYLIQFFLCLSQMGFVSSYLIFISENIGLAADTLSNCSSPIKSEYYIWMVLAGKEIIT